MEAPRSTAGNMAKPYAWCSSHLAVHLPFPWTYGNPYVSPYMWQNILIQCTIPRTTVLKKEKRWLLLFEKWHMRRNKRKSTPGSIASHPWCILLWRATSVREKCPAFLLPLAYLSLEEKSGFSEWEKPIWEKEPTIPSSLGKWQLRETCALACSLPNGPLSSHGSAPVGRPDVS